MYNTNPRNGALICWNQMIDMAKESERPTKKYLYFARDNCLALFETDIVLTFDK